MNPLIIWEKLWQASHGPDLRPGKRCRSLLQGSSNLGFEILIARLGLARGVPVRAATFRADPGLFFRTAARNPFVAAPLAAIAHDRDRHPCH